MMEKKESSPTQNVKKESSPSQSAKKSPSATQNKDTPTPQIKDTSPSQKKESPANLSPSSAGSAQKKKKTYNVEPRTPLKRQRVPVARYQSPAVEEIVTPKSKTPQEERTVLYAKNAFLAVRGDDESFFLCRLQQNVYGNSRTFKIQWLNLDTAPNIYKFDYLDSTDVDCVLTNIKMERIAKDTFRLPHSEEKRIQIILDKALKKEKGLPDDDAEVQVIKEDPDDSIEETPRKKRKTAPVKKEEKKKKPAPKASLKVKASPGSKKTSGKSKNDKKKKAKEKDKKKKVEKKKEEKKKGPDRKLKPNPNVKVLEKDPFFETTEQVPFISKMVYSKLAIRAVLRNDMEFLRSLIMDHDKVYRVDMHRSMDCPKSALNYAVETKNKDAIKLLMEEIYQNDNPRLKKGPPKTLLSAMETGWYNPASLGIWFVRKIGVSRGNREGNNAFSKEQDYPYTNEFLDSLIKAGIDKDLLEMIMSLDKTSTREDLIDQLLSDIHIAISHGHKELAGYLVTEAEKRGGHGFNFLHKEVLTFTNEDLKPQILAASVRKKPLENKGITPIHCAAINPNVKYLTRLLSIEPDFNLCDKSSRRPIHYAATCSTTAPLELLMKRGASPYEGDSSQNTALHHACMAGRAHNVDFLLKHAKSTSKGEMDPLMAKYGLGGINKPNRLAVCPIHMAVEEGFTDVLRMLVKFGADLNKTLSAGRNKLTPLMMAASLGHLDMVRFLVQSGAVVEQLDKLKRTALTHAVMNGHTHIVSYLLYLGADPNRCDSSGNSLVHYAAAYGWYFILKLLIKVEANLTKENDWKTTPVGIAFLKGNIGLVDILLKEPGVDINFKDEQGMTLVCNACSCQLEPGIYDQIVYLVKENKADPTIVDMNGMNALHHLAANNICTKKKKEPSDEAMEISVKVAKLLIDGGCSPTQRTNDSRTPIMLAIERVNNQLVKFLVENGGSVSDEKNKDGKTVLHMMAEQCAVINFVPLLEILTTKKQDESMEVDGEDVVKPESSEAALKKMTALCDKDGFTPLLVACNIYKDKITGKDKEKGEQYKNCTAFMRALIEKFGADVDAAVSADNKEKGKMAPIHFMLNASPGIKLVGGKEEKSFDGLELILAHKPNLKLLSANGMPPLALAVESRDFKKLDLLLSGTVDVNAVYKIGQRETTAFEEAVCHGNEAVITRLMKAGANINRTLRTDKRTPFLVTVATRNLPLVELLLKAGADVHAVDSYMSNALHIAVGSNSGKADTSTDLEEFLLEKNVSLFQKDRWERLPLHYAFVKNHSDCDTSSLDPIELCSLLTSAMGGKHVDDPDKCGQTPLHLAGKRGATICSIHLLQLKCDISRKDDAGNTPLALAVQSNHDGCAIMLIQNGGNANDKIVIPSADFWQKKWGTEPSTTTKKDNIKPVWKWIPLIPPEIKPDSTIEYPIFQHAIHNELQGVAHMLLGTSNMSQVCLQAALKVNKHNVALRQLKRLPSNADLSKKDEDGRNLFHLLAMHAENVPSTYKIAKILLDKGIPPNLSDKYGCIPLSYAALYHKNSEFGKFFIENDSGLDIRRKDEFGRELLATFLWDYGRMFADRTDTKNWLEILQKKGASLDCYMDIKSAKFSNFGHNRYSSAKGYLSTSTTDYKITPLIYAIHISEFGLAKFLLQNGASPNTPDSNGFTPLMHAVKLNDGNLVRLLLNYDYDPDKKNVEKTELKPELSKKLSRQVFRIKYDDDAPVVTPVDEGEGSDHSEDSASAGNDDEEEEDNVGSENEEVEEDMDEGDDFGEDDDDMPEEEEDEDMGDDEEEDNMDDDMGDDSDRDTDVVDDDEEEAEDENPPDRSAVSALVKQPSLLKKTSNKDEIFTLPKTSSVELSATDSQGWTVVHHIVCPLDLGTYDNDELLYVLSKAGAPIQKKDHAGLSPLDHALIRGAPKLAKMLQKLSDVSDDTLEKPTFPAFEISNKFPCKKIDFQADAAEMSTKLHDSSETNGDSNQPVVVKPDKCCSMKATGEVFIDKNQNIPYDATLCKVDVTCGTYGLYNFYKLQILWLPGKDMYDVFTRWGRIGDRGQYQNTPFPNKEEAVKEFCKIFKQKTGNDWNKIKTFTNHPKKYRMVQRESPTKLKEIEFKLVSELPSSLPPYIQDLIKDITNVNMLKAAIFKAGIDEELMPLGRIQRNVLVEASKILSQLNDLIEIVKKQRDSTVLITSAEHEQNSEKICSLTNEYYHLVPQSGYEYERIRPIDCKKLLKAQLTNISNLIDLHVAGRILLGSQHRLSEMNPLDYIYNAIGCKMEVMNETDNETQYILKYIWNSSPNSKVTAIYKLSRPGEDERLRKLNLDNHKLLWHGSSVANFISILNRGLLLCPPEVPQTGTLFGEGIYSADTFVKSASYCYNPSGSVTYALLCEVALGKIKEDRLNDISSLADTDYNSLLIQGQSIPNDDFSVTLPYGASMPLDAIVQRKIEKKKFCMPHNEYIVYNQDQICLRYLVQF